MNDQEAPVAKRNKRKLDVLLISASYPPERNGVAQHVAWLGNALVDIKRSASEKFRACVVGVLTAPIAPDTSQHPTKRFVQRYPAPGETRTFTVDGAPLKNTAQYALDLPRKIPPFKPDVIHAHDLESAFIGFNLKVAWGIPLIVTLHRTPKKSDSSALKRFPKDCFVRLLRDHLTPDCLVAPSTAYKDRLIEDGFSESKIRLIHHGVPGTLATIANDDCVFQRFNIKRGESYVFCPSSRLEENKGIEILIKAATRIPVDGSDPKYYIVAGGGGDADYKAQLIRFLVRLGLMEKFRLGPLDGGSCNRNEMATLYRNAMVCVVPSLNEGFGLVILEAFMYRSLVIASNTGGISDIVIPDKTGYTFHQGNYEDLASQLRAAISNSGTENAKIINSARESVKEKFSASRMAEKHLELYLELTNIELK